MAEGTYKEILKEIQDAMGKKTTTTAQLNEAGRVLFGRKYRGAWPADRIPKLRHGQVAIANLDDSKGPGTHWVALAQNKKKTIIYDSFGRKGGKILPTIAEGVDTESDAEQSAAQNNCGQRCLAALAVFEMYGARGMLKL